MWRDERGATRRVETAALDFKPDWSHEPERPMSTPAQVNGVKANYRQYAPGRRAGA